MKKLFKTLSIVYIMSFCSISTLRAANENREQMNTSNGKQDLAQYLQSFRPDLLDNTRYIANAQSVYNLLFNNTSSIKLNWSHFLGEWNLLNQTNKDEMICMLSQQSFKRVFIEEQDLPEIQKWIKSLVNDDHYFICPKNIMIYYDFRSSYSLINKINIIEWVYQTQDPDAEMKKQSLET